MIRFETISTIFLYKDIRDLFELNNVSRNTFPYAIVVPYLTTKIIYVNALCCQASEHVTLDGFLLVFVAFVLFFLFLLLLYFLSLFGWFCVMNIYMHIK